MTDDSLNLLPANEALTRTERLAGLMREHGIDAALLADNATKFYLTGRVFTGWILVSDNGRMEAFVRRPVNLTGDHLTYVRKPEDIPSGMIGGKMGLELSTMCVNDYLRLIKHLGEGRATADISPLIRQVRAVKTPYEINLISQSGVKQEQVYRLIPSLYRDGMTDLDLQIEIERRLRMSGCLGQFRISGSSMELFMGNILVGDNADTPTPYDFAMGGGGIHPSLPVGADNTVIMPGMSVMVDANGNFTGYMTDMTRTFRLGTISEEAMRAHRCSIDICKAFSREARPGVSASSLYDMAYRMAAEAGLEQYFMGHRQKAGFVGHGLGIEINEAPVIAPRSRDVIAIGNVIALEPKFVIPGTGAVGIENTYAILPDGNRCLTNAPEEILPLNE